MKLNNHILLTLAVLAMVLEVRSRSQDFNPRKVLRNPLPAITNAPVVAGAQATPSLVRDEELVLGVVHKGEARAYPINQLTGPRREIINDRLGGEPVAATW